MVSWRRGGSWRLLRLSRSSGSIQVDGGNGRIVERHANITGGLCQYFGGGAGLYLAGIRAARQTLAG